MSSFLNATHPNVRKLARYYLEFWNENREERLVELVTSDLKLHGVGDEPLGVNDFLEAAKGLKSTFSKIALKLEDMRVDGDVIATRMRIDAIHSGDGLGFPGTGKPVTMFAMTFTRWRGDRVCEAWDLVDMASVYRQLGLSLSAPSAS